MSLHTQYRPTTWDQVIGQSDIVAGLKQVVKSGRAKAFLFTGPSGTGKTTLARILANEFAGGKATVANMEEYDAASKSGADEVRDLIDRSRYRAVGGSSVKTIIIDEAHRLSGAAWTVLLKPIEEPAAHVFWVLCTTEPGKIPRTIQTRCLRYNLKPVGEEDVFELLQDVCKQEKLPVDAAILEAITEAAMGSPRQALVFLEACSACKDVASATAIMRTAASSGEAIDLARFLINPNGRTWAGAVKRVNALNEKADAESIRIVIVNYLAAVLSNTSGEAKAKQLLALMEPFLITYNTSDKLAPLFHSIGLALGLDQ